MILYHITGSPYWFLVKGNGMIALSEPEAYTLTANGMQSKDVTSAQLHALNTQLRAFAGRALYI